MHVSAFYSALPLPDAHTWEFKGPRSGPALTCAYPDTSYTVRIL